MMEGWLGFFVWCVEGAWAICLTEEKGMAVLFSNETKSMVDTGGHAINIGERLAWLVVGLASAL